MEKKCDICGSELVNGVCPNCANRQQTTYTQPQVTYEQSTNYASGAQNAYQQNYQNDYNYGAQNAYQQNYQNGYNNNGQVAYQQNYQNGYNYGVQNAYQQNNQNYGGKCPVCGANLINGVCPNCNNVKAKKELNLKRFFISRDEKPVATLGNTYIQTFLNNGYIKKGFAIVSNKRIYFQGTSYSIVYDRRGKKKINKTSKSQTIDLKDVTGTGFEYTSSIGYLIVGTISLIIMILLYFAMNSM